MIQVQLVVLKHIVSRKQQYVEGDKVIITLLLADETGVYDLLEAAGNVKVLS